MQLNRASDHLKRPGVNFETTFQIRDVDSALAVMEDKSARGKAARDAIRSIVTSGALGEDRLVHAHAMTSEHMVAVLVRLVEHPEDAR